MRALLERWSRLEPSRCNQFDDHMGGTGLQVTWTGTPMRAIPDDYPLDALDRALVLAAVIESIEARGWEWSLWSDGNEVSGDITIRDDDTNLGVVHGSGLKQLSTPAEALLAAYLAALEAQS